jgi:hypothetical protein
MCASPRRAAVTPLVRTGVCQYWYLLDHFLDLVRTKKEEADVPP